MSILYKQLMEIMASISSCIIKVLFPTEDSLALGVTISSIPWCYEGEPIRHAIRHCTTTNC